MRQRQNTRTSSSSNDGTNNNTNDDDESSSVTIQLRVPSIHFLFGCDLRSLAAFRMCLSLVVLYDLYRRYPSRALLLSDDGLWTRKQAEVSEHGFIIDASVEYFINPYMMFGSVTLVTYIMWIHMTAAIMMFVGALTPFSTFVVWVLQRGLFCRNFQVVDKGDHLMLLLAFWAIWCPTNRVFAVDSWLRRTSLPLPEDMTWASVGTAGMMLQPLLLYGFSAIEKWGDPSWDKGDMMYYSLASPRDVTMLGAWVVRVGWHAPVIMRLVALSTFWLELLAPLATFLPYRLKMIRSSLWITIQLLQLGFVSMLYLFIFPFCSFASMLPLMPSRMWELMGFTGGKKSDRDKKSDDERHPTRQNSSCCGGWWSKVLGVVLFLQISGHVGWARNGQWERFSLIQFEWMSKYDHAMKITTSWDMYVGGNHRISEWAWFAGVRNDGVVVSMRTGEVAHNTTMMMTQNHEYERFNMFLESVLEVGPDLYATNSTTMIDIMYGLRDRYSVVHDGHALFESMYGGGGERKLLYIPDDDHDMDVDLSEEDLNAFEEDLMGSRLEVEAWDTEYGESDFKNAGVYFSKFDLHERVRSLFCVRGLKGLLIGRVETTVAELPDVAFQEEPYPAPELHIGVKHAISCQ